MDGNWVLFWNLIYFICCVGEVISIFDGVIGEFSLNKAFGSLIENFHFRFLIRFLELIRNRRMCVIFGWSRIGAIKDPSTSGKLTTF